MIRTALIFTAATLLSTAVFAEKEKVVSEYNLHKCVSSENCSVLESMCPGNFVTVNIRYENLTRRKISENKKEVKCSKADKPRKAPRAMCVENQCTIK